MNAAAAPRSTAPATLLCFALRAEAAAFQKRIAAARTNPAAPQTAVELLFTGVGQRAAERALGGVLCARTPTRVLSCGFAGALHPELAVGTVGFATEEPALRAALLAAGAQPMRFVTVDRVAASAAQKAALWYQTGAAAAEMESAALEALCRARGIPFAVVRAISDTAQEDLPLDFNRLLRADGQLDWLRLLGALARRPAALAGLMRLRRQCRLASERLAEVLTRLLSLAG